MISDAMNSMVAPRKASSEISRADAAVPASDAVASAWTVARDEAIER